VQALAIGQAYDVTVTSSESSAVDVEVAEATGVALDPTVSSGNDAVVQVEPALGVGASLDMDAVDVEFAALVATATGEAYDATTLRDVDVAVELAAGTGAAFDVSVNADNDRLVAVGVALGVGRAFDVMVLGALPSGRIRVSGREPDHTLFGYDTREPRHRVSGRESGS
jgi:hypothetical protein